jgi:hypothetical protein
MNLNSTSKVDPLKKKTNLGLGTKYIQLNMCLLN